MQFCSMLQKLQARWKVNTINLLLILLTFALGGSTCARLAGYILKIYFDEKTFLWWVLYVVMVSGLWPICVLIISIPLGQFKFFKNYLQRIGQRMTGKKKNNTQAVNIAIFASGSGTNAQHIVSYFEKVPQITVAAIFCNNSNAGIVQKAQSLGIPVVMIEKDTLAQNEGLLLQQLQALDISFIVLAGFLKKIPSSIIKAYPAKIINIHPALLPKFGGKGMYGMHVHEAVIQHKEKESGITIHLVDEVYDNGKTIFQARCLISPDETPESLALKVRALEHSHFPTVVHDFIETQNQR